jgi:hypothetical protein
MALLSLFSYTYLTLGVPVAGVLTAVHQALAHLLVYLLVYLARLDFAPGYSSKQVGALRALYIRIN